MYLRPRSITEKFAVHRKKSRVDPSGRILIQFEPSGEILFGVMSQLNPKEKEKWQGTKHEASDVIVQKFGTTSAKVGDKLIKNDKIYLVASVEEVANTGWKIYYVNEREDLK